MKHSRCRKFLFVTVVLLSTTHSLVSAFMPSTSSAATISSPPSFCRFLLWATDNDNDNDSNDNNKNKQNQVVMLGKQQGVYSRPSAAIERGSGFFIPGLEGPKIRLVVGLVLLTATALNHAALLHPDTNSSSSITSSITTSSSATAIITTMSRGNVLAESLAVLTSLLVLLQASVEAVQEQQANIQIGSKQQQQKQQSTVASSSSSSTLSTLVTEAWSATNRSLFDNDNDTAAWRERVAWSARSYLALTAATQMLLIGPTGVLYRLSTSTTTTTSNSNNDDKESGKSITTNENDTSAALATLWETLQQSTSGRVALPTGHATAQALAPGQECVVVQRIIRDSNDDNDDMYCWMVTSPKSLASTLTQRDLRWLGPLAHYVGSGILS